MGLVRPNTSRLVERQPLRPHTSLGFATSADRLPCVGFDVRNYFRKHGSGAGLTVGVNGRPSSDTALQGYVQDCRAEVLLCELVCDGEERLAEEMAWREDDLRPHRTSGPRRLLPANNTRAPLCWDTVLQEASAKSGKVTSTLHVPVPVELSQNVRRKCANTFLQTLQTSRHMISYGDDCVKDWGSTVHLDIRVPNTDQCVSSQQSKLGKVQKEPHSLQPVPELLSALLSCEAGRDLHSSDPEGLDLLCVWFQVELSKFLERDLCHKRFKLCCESYQGTTTFTDLQLLRVMPDICVVAVGGIRRQDLSGTEVTLELSHEGTVIFSHAISLASTDEHTEMCPRFLFKRDSECDQMEDEDITDLRDIAEKYPDLCVLDIDGSEADGEGETERMCACEDGRRREEERGAVREREGETPHHQQPDVFITARAETEKMTAIYHSYPAPSTGAKGNYASIVRQHLAQYL